MEMDDFLPRQLTDLEKTLFLAMWEIGCKEQLSELCILDSIHPEVAKQWRNLSCESRLVAALCYHHLKTDDDDLPH